MDPRYEKERDKFARKLFSKKTLKGLIDLDGSGEIDGYEFQQALAKSNIANLPPWEMERLVSAVDLDGDGRLNLPELDIMLAKIRNDILDSEEE